MSWGSWGRANVIGAVWAARTPPVPAPCSRRTALEGQLGRSCAFCPVGAQGVTSKSKLLAREMPDLHTGGLRVDSGAT
eukprot:COSAG04_NODE_356_length_16034_cov_11.195168_20_plen_77_part_01